MIKTVYREGKIHPLDPVPRQWMDGQSLQISPDTTGSGPAEQFDRLAKAWKKTDGTFLPLRTWQHIPLTNGLAVVVAG